MNEYENVKKEKIEELAAKQNSSKADIRVKDFIQFAMVQLKNK
jgi:hypothetical protein